MRCRNLLLASSALAITAVNELLLTLGLTDDERYQLLPGVDPLMHRDLLGEPGPGDLASTQALAEYALKLLILVDPEAAGSAAKLSAQRFGVWPDSKDTALAPAVWWLHEEIQAISPGSVNRLSHKPVTDAEELIARDRSAVKDSMTQFAKAVQFILSPNKPMPTIAGQGARRLWLVLQKYMSLGTTPVPGLAVILHLYMQYAAHRILQETGSETQPDADLVNMFEPEALAKLRLVAPSSIWTKRIFDTLTWAVIVEGPKTGAKLLQMWRPFDRTDLSLIPHVAACIHAVANVDLIEPDDPSVETRRSEELLKVLPCAALYDQMLAGTLILQEYTAERGHLYTSNIDLYFASDKAIHTNRETRITQFLGSPPYDVKVASSMAQYFWTGLYRSAQWPAIVVSLLREANAALEAAPLRIQGLWLCEQLRRQNRFPFVSDKAASVADQNAKSEPSELSLLIDAMIECADLHKYVEKLQPPKFEDPMLRPWNLPTVSFPVSSEKDLPSFIAKSRESALYQRLANDALYSTADGFPYMQRLADIESHPGAHESVEGACAAFRRLMRKSKSVPVVDLPLLSQLGSYIYMNCAGDAMMDRWLQKLSGKK